MARINKKGIISGKIGDKIFRNLNNQQIVQAKPDKVNQTKNTVVSSSEFRQCSSWAKQLRIGLHSFLNRHTDSYMYRRLTGKLYEAIFSNTSLPKGQRSLLNSNMNALVGFEFNTNSPFREHFKGDILVSVSSEREVIVNVSELQPRNQIKYSQITAQSELLLYVYSSNMILNTPVFDAYFSIQIDRNAVLQPEIIWTSPTVPEGHFILVVAKLMYYTNNKFTGKNYINTKELSPAKVLYANAN